MFFLQARLSNPSSKLLFIDNKNNAKVLFADNNKSIKLLFIENNLYLCGIKNEDNGRALLYFH